MADAAGIPKSSLPKISPTFTPNVFDEARRKAAEVRKAGEFDRIDRALAPHVAALCQTSSTDLLLLSKVAAVYLAGEDLEAYRGLCQDLRNRVLSKGSAVPQSVLLRLMTLGPDALGDPQTLIDFIPTIPGHKSAENTRLYLEGTALYRAGRYEEALPPLQKAQSLSKTIPFGMQCTAFLAMTEFRLGQTDAAKKHLVEVDTWIRDYLGPTPTPRANPDRKVDVVLPLLRAEAAKLMGVE
jgi:tetratricopeptide (TPR) repeat protein